MLKTKLNGQAAELRSDEGEVIEFIKYDPIFSMFIVDKVGNAATMTITKEEMKQVYDVIGELLND